MNLGLWGSISPKTVLGAIRRGAGGVSVYTISGTVYDADGSTAVASATVALGALSATSAADGTYTISDVPPGTSGSMTCTKVGYSWTAITVAAMSGNLTGQNYTNIWYAAGGSLASVVVAYKPIGAASLAASYVNLANPGTNDAAPGVAPTHAGADGWTFNGSTQYLVTGDVPPNQVGRSVSVRISNGGTGGFILGSRNVSANLAVQAATPNTWFYNGTGAGYQHGLLITAGVVGVAGLDAYLDGSDVGNITAGTYDQSTRDVYIGCRNSNGSPATFWVGKVQAYVRHNATLTPTQMSILHTAMANLT